MTRRFLIVIALILAGICAAPAAFAQQKSYCGLVPRIGSMGALPPHTAVDDIIDDILLNGAQITTRNGFRPLANRTDPDLRQQIAAAEICNNTDRYIFYYPGAIDGLQKKGAGWVMYFVLAHEISHHINGDVLVHHEDPEIELRADENAAKWLTRLKASMEDIKASIDAIEPSEQRRDGYPARCERVSAAIRGYNAVARDYNRFNANMKVYQEGNCVLTAIGPPPVVAAPVVPATVAPAPAVDSQLHDDPLRRILSPRPPGLYATGFISAKAALRASDVEQVKGARTVDAPYDFAHDVDGMCAVTSMIPGRTLTWNNIGVCALMK